MLQAEEAACDCCQVTKSLQQIYDRSLFVAALRWQEAARGEIAYRGESGHPARVFLVYRLCSGLGVFFPCGLRLES